MGSDTEIDTSSPFSLAVIGVQIILALLICKFGWDISVFTFMAPLLIWIIASGIVSCIIFSTSPPKKGPSYLGKCELLAVVGIVNCVSIVCALLLIVAMNAGAFNSKMLELIKHYPHDLHKKQLMDKIQVTFQCCGAYNVTDWFYTEWRNDEIEPRRQITLDNEGWDSVPFSCCSPDAPSPCLSRGLITFGLNSLNHTPCIPTVVNTVTIYLLVLTILALTTAGLVANLAFKKGNELPPWGGNNEDRDEHQPLRKEETSKSVNIPEQKVEQEQMKTSTITDKLWARSKRSNLKRNGLPLSAGNSTMHITNRQPPGAFFDGEESPEDFVEVPASYRTSTNQFHLPNVRSSSSDPIVATMAVSTPEEHGIQMLYQKKPSSK